MADARYELLLAEALRRLELQHRDLTDLRSRAGGLISAAAVSTAFLGGQLKDGTSLETLAWAGVVLFAATLGVSLWALAGTVAAMPQGFSAEAVHRSWIESRDVPEDEIRLNLALRIEQAIDKTQAHLERRQAALMIGAALLGLEIVAWLLSRS